MTLLPAAPSEDVHLPENAFRPLAPVLALVDDHSAAELAALFGPPAAPGRS